MSNFLAMTNYLGFDLSTQKLKALVVDENLKIIYESNVHFDRHLPEFRTQGGVIKGKNGEVTVPVILWVKALDLLLDQMKLDGVDFSKIKALSGAAQQHGSVYWRKKAKTTLNNIDPSQFLYQQLHSCLSLKESPIWMDSSTSKYCKDMEETVGGPEKMAEITGSRAFERFTGPQIAKIVDQRPSVYENTERISLISSFACSLFLGDYANIDFADGSTMNLMNIKTNEWHDLCLKATKAENLEEKLGGLVPPHTDLGPIAPYFVERFGFNPQCRVISFTGDNPATLAGMHLSENDIAISLGTSDTLILSLPEPKIFLNGHVMRSPTEANGYMGLLCFKNGSLVRERFRNLHANGSWKTFNMLLDSTPRGNFGNIGLFFDNQEILPSVKRGEYRWNATGEKVIKYASSEIETVISIMNCPLTMNLAVVKGKTSGMPSSYQIRALIEGQVLTRRHYAEDLGMLNKPGSRIIATGGGSENKTMLQVFSDVFNLPVYVQKSQNAAALGSTYLAKMATEKNVSFKNIIKTLSEFELVCTPNKDSTEVYNPLLHKCRSLISSLCKQ